MLSVRSSHFSDVFLKKFNNKNENNIPRLMKKTKEVDLQC